MKQFARRILCTLGLTALLCLPAAATEVEATPISAPVDAITVQLNQTAIDFSDAQPQIVDGRTVIPFRAVFIALGFEDDSIVWDGDTRSVSATRDDLTLSLTIGEKQVTVTDSEGNATEFATDVAPFIDEATSRTYVPARFVAEAVGYRVGWDAEKRVVIIDDVAAILATNTETYEIMDMYTEYSNSFNAGKWSAKGSYAMDMNLMGETAKVSGDYTILTEGLALEMDTTLTASATSAASGVAVTVNMEDMNILMRGDMNEGVFYLKSKEMNEMMGFADENAWIALDLAAMMDQVQDTTGFSYLDLMTMSKESSEMSFADSLAMMLEVTPLTSADYTTADYLADLNAMFGDSAFKKSGNDYVSTSDLDGAEMTFTISTSGGKVTGYTQKLTAAQDGVDMSIVAGMDDMELVMEMSFVAEMEGMKMEMNMTMDGTYTSTSKSPTTEPPANAVVIDLLAVMGM